MRLSSCFGLTTNTLNITQVRELRSECGVLQSQIDMELQNSMDCDSKDDEITNLRKRCRLLEAEAETEQHVAIRARKESMRIASIAKRDMSLADEALAEADRRFHATESLLESMKKRNKNSSPSFALNDTVIASSSSSSSSRRRRWHDAHHTNGPFV